MSLDDRLKIAWTSLVVTLVIVAAFPNASVLSSQLLSVTVAVTGTAIFIVHGHRRVTVTGLFGLAVAVIMGYGGWVVAAQDPPTAGLYIALAGTSIGLVISMLLMRSWFRVLSSEGSGSGYTGELPKSSSQGDWLLLWCALFASLALVLVRNASPRLLIEGMAFTATLTLFFALMRRGGRVARWAPLLVVPHVVLYSEVFHGSTGRLRLVALLGGLCLLYSWQFGRAWHKGVVVLAMPLMLSYFAQDRLRFQRDNLGADVDSGASGLESLFAPARSFGLLIETQANGDLSLQWGKSLLSPLVSLWSWGMGDNGLSITFNYELVALTNPSRYGSGFSTAGSFFGEWWWNFGIIGIAIGGICLGFLLSIVDAALVFTLARLDKSWLMKLFCLALIAVGGGIADLAWGGLHTWLLRALARLPFLLIMIVLLGFLGESRRAPSLTPSMRRAHRGTL